MTPDTVAMVNAMLRIKWSPEQTTGFMQNILRMPAPCPVTIYEHVRCNQLAVGRLFACLRHGGRWRKSHWVCQYRGRTPNCVDVDERPAVVDARTCVGDWEIDLVMCAGLFLAKDTRRKTADATARALLDMLRLHRSNVRMLTFDNGREFSQHGRLARALGL